MKVRLLLVATVAAMLVGSGAMAQTTAERSLLGKVVGIQGTVEIGDGGNWQPAGLEQSLFEGQSLRTGGGSEVRLLFGDDVPGRLGENEEIAVVDLLLKTRLERVKSGISAPKTDAKTEMEVTPLTGVRGTEQSPEKAEELKREHFWNEEVSPAQ